MTIFCRRLTALLLINVAWVYGAAVNAQALPARPLTQSPPVQVASGQSTSDKPETHLQHCVASTQTEQQPGYRKEDILKAAEGVFGKGAKGLAQMVESILKKEGQPNGYISGREASGALVVGLRYGSGLLCHAVEGERKVHWTGPSVGFDTGGDATKVFVLVYKLYDTQDLYKRYPQVEGRAYYIGGLSATYLRHGKVTIIPVRLGVGLRLGANVGYMKFTQKSRWFPF